MKAFRRTRYGAPETLELHNTPEPQPEANQVLVRASAWSVNAHDWHMTRGKPYLARLGEGFRQPKDQRIGVDASGVIEAVGPAVTHLRVGDRVFGSRFGAYAELIAGTQFIRLPDGLSFEEGAALPTAGLTALQGLRDKAQLRAGDRALIVGAGGGVGTMAVQIAKALGAEVTAVTRTSHIDLVRSLGADAVLDYTRDDLSRLDRRFDVILDIAGTHRLRLLAGMAAPGGRVALVAPQPGQWIGPIARMAGAIVRTKLGRTPIRAYLADVNRADLETLAELAVAGSLRPAIERTYRFEEIPAAIRHVEEGRAAGKVVVRI
jgi:NADPH:quinone reductase-like Zn-dependent oxidoreductase